MERKAETDDVVKMYLEEEKEDKDADLLSCPFCGGKAVSWVMPASTRNVMAVRNDVAACYCRECRARVTVTREEVDEVIRSIVVAKWNRRVNEKT